MNRVRVMRGIALGAGVGLSMGAPLGAGMAWADHKMLPDPTRAELIDDFHNAQAEEAAASNTLKLTISSIGEVCVRALSPYSSSGPLKNTPENTIISDLSADPQSPCGDNPSQIRQNTREFLNADYSAQNAADGLANAAKQATREDYVYDPNEPRDAALVVGVSGIVIGGFVGGLISERRQSRKTQLELIT